MPELSTLSADLFPTALATDAELATKAPLSHTHSTADVTGLDTALAGKAPTTHTHAQSDVTGLAATLAGKANASHTHATADVTGLDTALAGKAAATHTHAQSDVTGLAASLAGKANSTHTHATSDVTGLDTALAGKAASTHTHAQSDITGLSTALAAIPTAAAASDIRTGTDTTKFNTSGALVGSADWITLTDGTTISWDMSLGYNAKVTLGGNRTLATPTNAKAGLPYTLQIIQDATGSRTLTLPASTIIDFGSAGTPTLSTAAGKIDIIFLVCLVGGASPVFRASFNKAS